MKTYTLGTTPPEVIRKALPERYEMMLSLGSDDIKVMQTVLDFGIDSHLEAVTDTKVTREEGNILGNRPTLDCSRNDMLVIIRRLWEIADSDSKLSEAAMSLRSSILSSINIEEV